MLIWKSSRYEHFRTRWRLKRMGAHFQSLPVTDKPSSLRSGTHNAECSSFASYFHVSDIKDARPCSAVFLFLAVHGQTCSVIGFKSLHHKRLELGFLQPPSDQLWLPSSVPSPLLTDYARHEALASLLRNEAAKKKGAQIRITALTNP